MTYSIWIFMYETKRHFGGEEQDMDVYCIWECLHIHNVELRKKLATPLRTLMHCSSCLLHQSDFKIFLVFDRRLRWKWSAVKGARGWRTDYGINDNLVI